MTTAYAAPYVQLQALSLPLALARRRFVMDGLLAALAAVLAFYALVDVPLQRLLFLRNQRMSKQEVKEEYKQSEGRPECAGHRATGAAAATVPGAACAGPCPRPTYVIVSPSHYAVALRYDQHQRARRPVVAKASSEMALSIRSLAREHRVRLLELLRWLLLQRRGCSSRFPRRFRMEEAVAQVLGYGP